MEIDLEDLKGHFAVKIFNAHAQRPEPQSKWIPAKRDDGVKTWCELIEVNGDNVDLAIVSGEGEDQDIDVMTVNRHNIEDFMEIPEND